ncbi:unnamed protein product [Rhodiola kirilowii]
MIALCWNCRGLGQLRSVQSLSEMVRSHKPCFVALIETKVNRRRLEEIRRKLGFAGGFVVDRVGLAGGLVIWWKEEITLSVLSYSRSHIDCMVGEGVEFRLTVFYGNPVSNRRAESWELLKTLSRQRGGPWLVLGDFNEVLFGWEYKGRRLRREWQMRSFREAIEDCGITDLGYKGAPFTYSNKREGIFEMRARLDRAFGNNQWRSIFPEVEVRHLVSSVSDHYPLLVHFHRQKRVYKKRLFRFEPMWLRHEGYSDFIIGCWKEDGARGDLTRKLRDCRVKLARWNKQVFGRADERVSMLKAELECVKNQFRTPKVIEKEARVSKELEEWLAREELFWRQRARVEWLKEGDANTKFFHERASCRDRRNTILRIKEGDRWIIGEEEICRKAMQFYADVFRQDKQMADVDWSGELQCMKVKLSNEAYHQFNTPFTTTEVQEAIFQLGSTKAPGIDGFSALFYQKSWEVIKEDVFQFALKFLNEGELDPAVNETLITLVPKVKNPECFSDYRPISLVNVAMKIITKAMANRLKGVLAQLISVSQSAFIPGRLISDNILLAHELMHYIKTGQERGAGYCGIKLDMRKAYDRVNWDYLEQIQLKVGFPVQWVDKVMRCVKSVSYRVRVNGLISESFCPERGLRQGDPLSPYLFVLCTEWLARSLEDQQVLNLIRGIRVARTAPMISNLMFADDSILFVRAEVDDIMRLKSILVKYEDLSGQQVNLSKSEVCPGNNVGSDRVRLLTSILGMRSVARIDRYLGLPICFSRRKGDLFSFIESRIWKKINGWKERLLSTAGKEILIKSVIQPIPIYAMSCFKFPVGLCKRLFSLMAKYWWNDAKGKKFITWVSKDRICRPKEEGGMAFKHFDLVNDALLTKQAGRLLSCPDLLISRVYKARYFPSSDLVSAGLGPRPSWAWRSIHKVIPLTLNWFSLASSGTGTVWECREDTEFTVKKIYEFLSNQKMQRVRNIIEETSDTSRIRRFWRKLWRVKAQEKVKIFMWKLFNNALPSALNLFNRGCEVETSCLRCGFRWESTDHIFLKCWWSTEFWRLLMEGENHFSLNFSSVEDWLWYCVNGFDKKSLSYIFYGARFIWYARNSLWHEGVLWDVREAVQKVKRLVAEFLEPSHRFVVSRHEAARQWFPPVEGFIKVNEDGAWDPSRKAAGYGFVCRSFTGAVESVGAGVLEGLKGVVEAEGVALKMAMEEAVKKRWSKVVFVTDNLEVYELLLKGRPPGKSVSSWFLACKSMMECNQEWRIEHVLRDANEVADFLARKALRENWGWSLVMAVPSCLCNVFCNSVNPVQS